MLNKTGKVEKTVATILSAGIVGAVGSHFVSMNNSLSNPNVQESQNISEKCRADISTCTDGIEGIKFIFKKEAERQEKEGLTQSIFHSELSAINDQLMKTYLNSGDYREVNTRDNDMDFCQSSHAPFGRYVANTKNETGDICVDAERLPTGHKNNNDHYLSM